jgi:hypothetical protein
VGATRVSPITGWNHTQLPKRRVLFEIGLVDDAQNRDSHQYILPLSEPFRAELKAYLMLLAMCILDEHST